MTAARLDPDADPGELAARHGLTISGARPGLAAYTRQIWARRQFIAAYATARLTSTYTSARLGQAWQVLTPLLNAVLYYLIFGLLLETRKQGITNYVPYLCTGVFLFSFTQATVQSATRSIEGNLGLVRALHFPRACLPISFTLVQLQQLLFSMSVLLVIVVGFGEPITSRWLLAVPALALQTIFNVGLALVMARIGARFTDTAQLVPFLLRAWIYVSGVFYNLKAFAAHAPHWVSVLLDLNPAVVYMGLMRSALLTSVGQPVYGWQLGLAWAAVIGAGGYVFFWQAEEEYGRG